MRSMPKLVVLLGIAIAPLLTVFYAIQVVNGVPLGDEWRWFRDLLLPYVDGEIGFWTYITGEYSFLGHTHFLTLLSILICYQHFSLDLVYLAYFGLVFYVFGGLMLMAVARRYLPDHPWHAAMCVVLVGVAYFSITTDFPWLLVSFEYFYYFFSLVFLVLVDAVLRGRAAFGWLCLATFFSTLFLDSMGAVLVCTTIVALVAGNLFDRKGIYQSVALLGIFVLTWALLDILIVGRVGTSSVSRIHTLSMLLNSPLDIFISLLMSFSQPLLDKAVLQHFFPSDYRVAQMIVGVVGLTLVAVAIYGYALNFNGEKSRLPFLVAGYAIVAWVFILTTRYSDFGVGIIDAQRFTRFFSLYYVAAALAFSASYSARKALFTFAVIMIGSYAISAGYQYRYVDGVKHYFQRADAALREPVLEAGVLDKYIGACSDRRCDKTIYRFREKGSEFVQVPSQ